MAENRSKKRVFLSVTQKMTIAEKLERKVSAKALSAQYGVSRDVIYRIRREDKELSNFGTWGHKLQHKNRRKSANEELENRLYSWILEQQAVGYRISDSMLQEKASEFSSERGSTSFGGSRGWLNKFKRRYDVRLERARGEEVNADQRSAEQFVGTFETGGRARDEEARAEEESAGNFEIRECREIVHLKREEAVNGDDGERNVKEEVDGREGTVNENSTEQTIKREVDEHEEQNRTQADGWGEEEIEERATETDFEAVEEKKKDLNLLRHIIQKYANDNPAILIMGDAVRKILENETPRINDGRP